MIDLVAPIIPGKSIAGLNLGQRIDEIITYNPPMSVIPLLRGMKHVFSSVLVWSVDGVVYQIGAAEGYRGSTLQGITIGSTLAEVEKYMGLLDEDDEDNLVVVGIPGFCFETELWLNDGWIQDNLIAKITEIFVY